MTLKLQILSVMDQAHSTGTSYNEVMSSASLAISAFGVMNTPEDTQPNWGLVETPMKDCAPCTCDSVPESEHGWLIEDQSTRNPSWLMRAQIDPTGCFHWRWTTKAKEAIRFANRYSAEVAIACFNLEDDATATEHSWDG